MSALVFGGRERLVAKLQFTRILYPEQSPATPSSHLPALHSYHRPPISTVRRPHNPHNDTLPCLTCATGCCGHACTGQHNSNTAGDGGVCVCAHSCARIHVRSHACVTGRPVPIAQASAQVNCASTHAQPSHDVGNTAPLLHALP